jgi:pimeloyl-ACP methyl ester carboxylesterase
MQESNVTVVRNNGRDRAVVFVHGFTGTRDDTWDRFPLLFGSATPDWDIFTIGYATSLLPDILGIWAADPDIPIVSTMLRGHLGLLPLQRYASVSVVAHSMGGLVVQQALVEDPALAARVRHVVLFGTPSAGLRKASWAPFWKRQLHNMAEGSPFITRLRSEWTRLYGTATPFVFVAVAGERDQFVPPISSLEPFAKACQQVVPGDHLSMVKPATPDAPSVQLLLTTLAADAAPARDSAAELRLAVERPDAAAARIVGTLEAGVRTLSVKEVVDSALALERAGKRAEAVALLERHQDRDTDIKGVLAGRIKRMWLESEEPHLAARALRLYQDALNAATSSDQIYYHAINVAFMRFTFLNDPKGARDMAAVALEHASPPGDDLWKVATVAEAHLYFDRIEEALAGYRVLLRLEAEPWKHQSASLQAGRIAARRGDRALAEALEAIFTPGARCVNHIVVSHSGSDRVWFERLQKMLSPYLRSAEGELVAWDDRARSAGGPWDLAVRQVLPRAGVVIALVSPDWLASDAVMTQELPLLLQAARESGLRLLWVSVSAAIWEETPLADPQVFHRAHDPNVPFDLLAPGEQNLALKSLARQAKEAALGAVTRFQQQPAAEPAVA